MVKGTSVAGAVLAASAAKSRLVNGFQPVDTGDGFCRSTQQMNQRLAGIFKMHWNLFEVGQKHFQV